MRRIIHVDMDAFYASIEQRDRPELRGRPVVVGGDPNGRGVVAAASYEARAFGIHSAMPSARALRLCPKLICLRPDMARYKAASEIIRGIFAEVTDLVEPLSLDEAYLDVTENRLGLQYGRDVARWIKSRIRDQTGLSASAGVAPFKFLAKVASDLRKPDGLVIIPPERVDAFIEDLLVEKIWGVGPATARRLHELGIRTGGQLRRADSARLQARLGKAGRFLQRLACGDDPRPVNPHRIAKSLGAEVTLRQDVTDQAVLCELIDDHAVRLASSLHRKERRGKTITLKVRYADFSTITRSRTLGSHTRDKDVISNTAMALMQSATEAGSRPIRLIGVSISQLDGGVGPEQLWFDFPLP